MGLGVKTKAPESPLDTLSDRDSASPLDVTVGNTSFTGSRARASGCTRSLPPEDCVAAPGLDSICRRRERSPALGDGFVVAGNASSDAGWVCRGVSMGADRPEPCPVDGAVSSSDPER